MRGILLDESVTLARMRMGHSVAVSLGSQLLTQPQVVALDSDFAREGFLVLPST